MARHKKDYAGAIEVNLGDFSEEVVTSDVAAGAAAGLAGAGLAKYLVASLAASGTVVPDALKAASPALGGLAAGFLLWKMRGDRAGAGNFAGAAVSGLVLAAAALAVKFGPPWLASAFAGFGGNDWTYDGRYGRPVGLNIPMQGLIVDDAAGESDQRLHGLIVDDEPSALRGYADQPGMSVLAAASLDPDEDYSELAGLAALGTYRELDVEGQG